MGEKVIISTKKELQEYAELMFKDISKALEMHVSLGKELLKPLEFRVSSEEDEVYITYTWMKVFIAFQDDMYDFIKKALGRNLTSEEKTKLELKVYISKGSNVYQLLIEISDFFADIADTMEDIVTMTPAQILAVTIPAALVWGFGRFYMQKKKAELEKYKLDIDLQKEKISSEAESTRKKLDSETLLESQRINLEQLKASYDGQRKALDVISDIVTTKENSEAKTARQLLLMPDSTKLEVSGKEIKREDLAEIGKRKTRTAPDTEIVHVSGNFKTDVIVYPEGDSREISISGTCDDGSPFKQDRIPVSKNLLTPEVYERINQGKPVHWDFTMSKKGGKVESIILKSVNPVSDGNAKN